MISILLVSAVLATITVPKEPPQIQYERLLEAIAFVESKNDDAAIGNGGERGRYQFTEATWYSLTSIPFEKAHDPDAAKAIALKHLTNMAATMRRVGRHESQLPFLLAVAWNAGEAHAYHNCADPAICGYGNRVVSLYTAYIIRSLGKWSSFPTIPASPEQSSSSDPASSKSVVTLRIANK